MSSRGGTEQLNYYEILKLPKTATQEEIRAQYKALATQLHPDKYFQNADKFNSTRDFQNLVEAYTVLSDPKKRAMYDRYGRVDLPDDYFRAHHRSHRHEYEDEEEYSDEDEYEDDDDEEEFECFCPFHGRARGRSFHDIFAEYFARHYARYGFSGFDTSHGDADDGEKDGSESNERSFWRAFARATGRPPRGRFVADWDSVPDAPSVHELRERQVPDVPARPRAVLARDASRISLEWAKKTPRKTVTGYVLAVRQGPSDAPWTEHALGLVREYRIDRPTPGLAYAFRLKAVNRAGESGWSEVTTVNVPGPSAPAAASSASAPSSSSAGASTADPKRAAEARLARLVREIETALAANSGRARLERAVATARAEQPQLQAQLAPADMERLAAALQRAQAALRALNREAERAQLLAKLQERVRGDEEAWQALRARAQEFARAEPDPHTRVRFENELRRLSGEREAHLQRMRQKEEARAQLQDAMAARDTEALARAIDMAKRAGVATKRATKLLAQLQKPPELSDAEAATASQPPSESKPKPQPQLAEPPSRAVEAARPPIAQDAQGQSSTPSAQPAISTVDEEEILQRILQLSAAEYEREQRELEAAIYAQARSLRDQQQQQQGQRHQHYQQRYRVEPSGQPEKHRPTDWSRRSALGAGDAASLVGRGRDRRGGRVRGLWEPSARSSRPVEQAPPYSTARPLENHDGYTGQPRHYHARGAYHSHQNPSTFTSSNHAIPSQPQPQPQPQVQENSRAAVDPAEALLLDRFGLA